ncbi:MAG TPA: cytochrome c oxidase assembly protein [Cerasibacillus sp.]|uniref:cytochrome c oxidase assembly protein n=1 Tax=Cerasibacillus sp. TaxID=2498711 RepID=UPI002F414936
MIEALLHGQGTWNLPLLGIAMIMLMLFWWFSRRDFTTNNPTEGQWHFHWIQSLFFVGGIVLLYLIVGSPLLVISYLSFSFHMIHMSVLFFVVPPLLLLGVPYQLYIAFRRIPLIEKIAEIITPNRALIAFSFLFLLYHIPMFLTFLSTYAHGQRLFMLVLFFLSFRMWWPIASPNRKRRLDRQKMKQYAMKSGIFIMPACLFFIASGWLGSVPNPFFSQLTTHLCIPPNGYIPPLLPPPFNTKYDQVLAGLLMLGLHKVALTVTYRLSTK